MSLADNGNNATKPSKTCRNSERCYNEFLWVHMHEYKRNRMHSTSEEALMPWLEALKLIFQSWEQIMEHLVGGLQSQALGFRSLLSVKDVYLKRSTTRALISCLAAGIPQHSNLFTALRRYKTYDFSGRWWWWLPGELNCGYFSEVKWLKQSCE